MPKKTQPSMESESKDDGLFLSEEFDMESGMATSNWRHMDDESELFGSAEATYYFDLEITRLGISESDIPVEESYVGSDNGESGSSFGAMSIVYDTIERAIDPTAVPDTLPLPGIMSDEDGFSPVSERLVSSATTPFEDHTFYLSPSSLHSASPPSDITSTAQTANLNLGNTSPSDAHGLSAAQRSESPNPFPQPKRAIRGTKKKHPRQETPKQLRPCDERRQRRKIEKPVACECGKRFAWQRELERHYKIYHKSYAAEIGLSTARIPCPHPVCVKDNKTFSRKDHLTRHWNKIHGR